MFSSSRVVMSHITVCAIEEKFPTTGTKRKYANVMFCPVRREIWCYWHSNWYKPTKKPLSLFDEGCRKPQVTRQRNLKNDGRIKSEPYSYSLVSNGKQEAGAGDFKNRQPVDILS
jgi:hypothetical protein